MDMKISSLAELGNYLLTNVININGDSKFHVGDRVYIVDPEIDYTEGIQKIIDVDSIKEETITKVSLFKNTQNGEIYFIYSVKGKEDMILECQIFQDLESAQVFSNSISKLGAMGYHYLENTKSRIKLFSHCEFERRN